MRNEQARDDIARNGVIRQNGAPVVEVKAQVFGAFALRPARITLIE